MPFSFDNSFDNSSFDCFDGPPLCMMRDSTTYNAVDSVACNKKQETEVEEVVEVKEKDKEVEEEIEEDMTDGKCHANIFNQQHEHSAPIAVIRSIGSHAIIETCKLLIRSTSPRGLPMSRSKDSPGQPSTHHRQLFAKIRKTLKSLNAMRCFKTGTTICQAKKDVTDRVEEYIITPEMEAALGKPRAAVEMADEETKLEKLNISDVFGEVDFKPSEVSEVIIINPEAEDGSQKVDFGIELVTINIETYLLHICESVDPDGLAYQFGFRKFDEILMINSDGTVNRSHKDVLEMFANLKTEEVITLVIRRYLDIEVEDHENIEYIRTIGEILVDEEGASEVKVNEFENFVTSAGQKIINSGEKQKVHISGNVPLGYLRFDGKQLVVKKGQAIEGDKSFDFNILPYIILNMGKPAVIIEASETNFFLMANSDDTVHMIQRDVDSKGSPSDETGLLFLPLSNNHKQKYRVFGEENKYLAWSADGQGLCIEYCKEDPGNDPRFTFEIWDK